MEDGNGTNFPLDQNIGHVVSIHQDILDQLGSHQFEADGEQLVVHVGLVSVPEDTNPTHVAAQGWVHNIIADREALRRIKPRYKMLEHTN